VTKLFHYGFVFFVVKSFLFSFDYLSVTGERTVSDVSEAVCTYVRPGVVSDDIEYNGVWFVSVIRSLA